MHFASTGGAKPHPASSGVPVCAQFLVLNSALAMHELTRSTQISALSPSMVVAPASAFA
jgi:hypothetical protein